MNQFYLKSFFQLQDKIAMQGKDISPRYLYDELLNWGRLLSDSKNLSIKNLHTDYFLYFDGLDLADYFFQPLWYNLNDIVENDFLKIKPRELKNAVVVVRDMIWELVVFKSNRECKILPNNCMRVFTDKLKEQLFFCCDMCDYTEDINRKEVLINRLLLPATIQHIRRNNILPCIFHGDNE